MVIEVVELSDSLLLTAGHLICDDFMKKEDQLYFKKEAKLLMISEEDIIKFVDS